MKLFRKFKLPVINLDPKVIGYVIAAIAVIALVYLIYTFVMTPKEIIPESPQTIKLVAKPELFQNYNLWDPNGISKPKITREPTNLVFEPQDLTHYQNQPLGILDYIEFDLDNGTVDIPEVDKQNTHDSIVQRVIRDGYSGVEKGDLGSFNKISKDIKRASRNNQKVGQVLDRIKSRNANITNLSGDSEKQVLVNIWEQVKDNPDSVKFFISNLKDCVENEDVVCPTGVVTRIVSTVYLDTPEQFPRTKEIIKQEMLQTAAKLRNDNPEEEHDHFKQTLLNKYNSDYQGILTEKEIIKEVNDWIDHV